MKAYILLIMVCGSPDMIIYTDPTGAEYIYGDTQPTREFYEKIDKGIEDPLIPVYIIDDTRHDRICV